MGWFSKKKVEEKPEEIPKLPELPDSEELVLPSKADLPEPPQSLPKIETTETKPLPSLPKIPEQQPSPEIQPDLGPIEPKMPPIEPKFQPIKTKKLIKPDLPDMPKTLELETPPEFSKPVTKKMKPVYVRLDKFETTAEAFEDIKAKITEIAELLKKVKTIKTKEEQELEQWEREIQIIKARIESIDKNIFHQLD